MKLKLREIDKRWKEYALAGCVCILFLFILLNLTGIFAGIAYINKILKPVIIGFVIAYIVNPLAVFFEDKLFGKLSNKKIAWLLSVALTLILVIALITVLISALIPQLIDNVVSLIENLPNYIVSLREYASLQSESALLFVDNLVDYVTGDDGLITRAGHILSENLTGIVNVTSNIGNALVSGGIGVIIAIYFLLAKKNIAKELKRFLSLALSPLKYERTLIMCSKFHSIFSNYIICELIDAAIIMVLNLAFMNVMNMPDALFVSVIVGVTNLAPTFGPIIGAAFGGFILLLVKPAAVLPFLIFTAILQSADSYVIKPKLFGGALNVPGVLILIAIIVFGKLMGVIGMLLAIPFAAIIVYLYSETLIPWLQLKKDMAQYQKEQQ